MLAKLSEAIQIARERLDDLTHWNSLIINRQKPYTYHIFTQWNDISICLHRVEPCIETESSFHPPSCPSAVLLLEGQYLMRVGFSHNRLCHPSQVCQVELVKGSRYEITNPLTWHTVTPLVECYTIIVNKAPWPSDITHVEVRTTEKKDQERMSEEALGQALRKFKELISVQR